MGRKGNFVEKTPSGPGRKAKKQKPPTLPDHLKEGMLKNRHILFLVDLTY